MKTLDLRGLVGIGAMVFAAALVLPVEAQGPFGLEMGTSLDSIREEFGISGEVANGMYYILKKVPRPHSSFESYAVQVSESSGLCSINGMGIAVESSSHGVQVRARFNQLREQLEGAYGASSEIVDRILPGSIWDEPEDFMMGLLKKERILNAEWSQPGRNAVSKISLITVASDRSSARVSIRYELDNFTECEKEIQEAESSVL